MGCTAFGERRQGDWRAAEGKELPTLAKLTNRGYTGHEHIESMGLIHMNGRVYDAGIGRFLSADPYVQHPYSSQSYNRYSYVLNNPLKYTDPSGFWDTGLDDPAFDSGNDGGSYGSGEGYIVDSEGKPVLSSSGQPVEDSWGNDGSDTRRPVDYIVVVNPVVDSAVLGLQSHTLYAYGVDGSISVAYGIDTTIPGGGVMNFANAAAVGVVIGIGIGVVVYREISTVEVRNFIHGLRGKGKDLIINLAEVKDVVRTSTMVGSRTLVTFTNGQKGYVQTVDTYGDFGNGQYDQAYGKADVYMDFNGQIVGFRDRADYNPSDDRNVTNEGLTSMGAALVDYGVLDEYDVHMEGGWRR